MIDPTSATSTPRLLAAAAVAVATTHAEKTERSPLLYAWWALNLAVLIALGYGTYRLVKTWRAKRRPRG
ncbi:hypothetical protein OHS33_35305 [Streptomyces sp. NBC_00536]|uniref:hypothetical protein n=1 Tax=Streptomyces sp. NBC_00536 TaxID=2975769 RepID=UPI002E7FFCB2|nr:hypothetical protein [Streptomyces sp. NBC_00536]WUC83179.1 hypothetical protein OHS33_35305 [Streptomyces sp. NBC_00536]